MTDTDAYANFNRRIDMSMAKVPYGHYQARTEVFRKNGVRTAYTKDLMPIMYRANRHETGPAPDFKRFATAWELKHSQVVVGEARGSVFPVVDETGLVIGHYGMFYFSSVFVPGHIPSIMDEHISTRHVQVTRKVPVTLDAILRAEFEVFAEKYDAQSYYARGYQAFPIPEMMFTLVTDIDGQVQAVVESRSTAGGVEAVSYSPLDLIFIARSALALAGRLTVRTLARRKAANMAQTARHQLGVGAGSGGEVAKIPVQARKVTQADILAWEKEGGHIVQNHGPQLTREKLKERILKQEKNIPNPANRPRVNGEKPDDIRVWRGADHEDHSTKWASDEIMRRTIGEVINKNLEQIRHATKTGQEFIVRNQRVDYTTGSGWIIMDQKKAKSVVNGVEQHTAGIVWEENVRGVTIVIRARKNHVPTAKDPEGWYVHTAFPSPARVAP
jgi:hypothetical protein